MTSSFSTGGFDYIYQLDELERGLQQLLGCDVDVVPEPVYKKRFQDEIDRDRAIAF